DFLAKQGVAGPTLEAFLTTNLLRFASEQRSYEEKLRASGSTSDPGAVLFARGTLFESRGLSVDTSLLPNYALEDTLRALQAKGVLSAGSVRRVAVIGPGLDFADKRDGYDFYPVQTIQPFAVLEAVGRLQLTDPVAVQVVASDLNPAVVSHIKRLSER